MISMRNEKQKHKIISAQIYQNITNARFINTLKENGNREEKRKEKEITLLKYFATCLTVKSGFPERKYFCEIKKKKFFSEIQWRNTGIA